MIHFSNKSIMWRIARVFFLLGVCLGLFTGQHVVAQSEGEEVRVEDVFTRLARTNGKGQAGVFTVRQSPELQYLVSEYTQRHAQTPGMMGFRVLVYRGLGQRAREEASAVQARVLNQWAGLPVYILYTSPYYKVCVGDCRTQVEAFVLRNHLQVLYPQSFVVSDWINFPVNTLKEVFFPEEKDAL